MRELFVILDRFNQPQFFHADPRADHPPEVTGAVFEATLTECARDASWKPGEVRPEAVRLYVRPGTHEYRGFQDAAAAGAAGFTPAGAWADPYPKFGDYLALHAQAWSAPG